MSKQKSNYNELAKKYGKEELASSYVFPSELSQSEEEQTAAQLLEERKKRLSNRTSEERMYAGLLGIRYRMKAYVKQSSFDKEQSSSIFLKDYLRVINKKQKELAEDIGIHVTRMSRILNGKEMLSLALAYRLEIHSGELIPALLWWKLVQKEQELAIKSDVSAKEAERVKVKQIAYSPK